MAGTKGVVAGSERAIVACLLFPCLTVVGRCTVILIKVLIVFLEIRTCTYPWYLTFRTRYGPRKAISFSCPFSASLRPGFNKAVPTNKLVLKAFGLRSSVKAALAAGRKDDKLAFSFPLFSVLFFCEPPPNQGRGRLTRKERKTLDVTISPPLSHTLRYVATVGCLIFDPATYVWHSGKAVADDGGAEDGGGKLPLIVCRQWRALFLSLLDQGLWLPHFFFA